MEATSFSFGRLFLPAIVIVLGILLFLLARNSSKNK